MTSRPDVRRVLRVLRPAALVPHVVRVNREYRLMFVADAASSLGTMVSTLAFPLLVLHLGGSAVQAGSIATVSLAVRLVLRLPAGAFVDRRDPFTVLVATDVVRLLALGSVPVVALLAVPTYPQLLAVALVDGLAGALFGPAVGVAVRDVATRRQLPEAMALDQAVQGAANLAGPALGGVLFVAWPLLPFVVDAASYGLSAVLLTRVAGRPLTPSGWS